MDLDTAETTKNQVNIQIIKEEDSKLYFTIGKNEFSFHYFWLRDHCRCEQCYNHATFQRSVHILEIPDDIKPFKTIINNGNLEINWNDGHLSSYPPEFFLQNNHNSWLLKQKRQIIYWAGDEIKDMISCIKRDEFISTDEGLKNLLNSLLVYGVAFIDGVYPTKEDTELVIRRIASPQSTIFGTMWSVSKKLEHPDTAYYDIALACHTDNTYFSEASGLQIFHCIEECFHGGETILRDGFDVVKKLEKEHPQYKKLLTSEAVSSEYIEEGQDYKCVEPVIKYNKITGDLEQIRYNVYDRAPFISLPEAETALYYKALRCIAKEIENKECQWHFKLKPGRLLVFDNWRVLHGRAAFKGSRHLYGCYISRSDWLSRARAFGLIG